MILIVGPTFHLFKAVKRKKLRHIRPFRALKFESVQKFTSAKYVCRKRCITLSRQTEFHAGKTSAWQLFHVQLILNVKILRFQKGVKFCGESKTFDFRLFFIFLIFFCKIMSGTAHASCVWPLWSPTYYSKLDQRFVLLFLALLFPFRSLGSHFDCFWPYMVTLTWVSVPDKGDVSWMGVSVKPGNHQVRLILMFYAVSLKFYCHRFITFMLKFGLTSPNGSNVLNFN